MSDRKIVDFVALVKNNPLTKLTSDYNSKIIERVRSSFTGEEQQLFVANYYCFLNHKKTDFVIDLDLTWKWIGFGKKSDCKSLLINNFTDNSDYIIQLENSKISVEEEGTKAIAARAAKPTELKIEPKNIGGRPNETILLTTNCFKLLCLKAKTKKSHTIHQYYINLEEIMNELVTEQAIELRNKLQIKEIEFIEEKYKLIEITLLSQFPINEQCIYYGIIDNVSGKNEKLLKAGFTNELGRRIKEHKKTYKNFRLLKAFKVSNMRNIENCIKNHSILQKNQRSLVIEDHNYVELYAYEQLTMDKFESIINKIIKETEYNIENYTKLLGSNNDLEIELNDLKNENKKLLEKNKTLTDKLIKYAPTSVSEIMVSEETKQLQKNMTTNISSNGFYLYAFGFNDTRFKIGICKTNGIENKEKIYKISEPSGSIKHRVYVKNNFVNDIMIYLVKKNLQILDKDIYESTLEEISIILNTVQKIDEFFTKYNKDINSLYEFVDGTKNDASIESVDPEEPIVKKSKRPVDMINTQNGDVLSTFSSLEEAGRFIGVTGTAVGIALRNKKLCKGYLFRYSGISTEDQYKDQPVIKINCNTGEQIKFNNIASAAKDSNISAPGMRNRINTNVHISNYHWIWDKNTTHYTQSTCSETL
jgi:hypothetical protein